MRGEARMQRDTLGNPGLHTMMLLDRAEATKANRGVIDSNVAETMS